jgi:CRISPR-associated protein Csb1
MDADHVVCDLVAWERMVQRLGRVNRRGDGDAKVVVVVESEPAPSDGTKEALEKRDASRAAAQQLGEEQKKELEKEAKAKKVELSEKGFHDAPATFRKTKIPNYDAGMPNPEARVLGGVLAKGDIERDVTINLVALRGLRGKDDKETKEVQKYLLSLVLLAATADLELFLREGCLLRYADKEDAWTAVPRRGEPAEVSLPTRDQLQAYATTASAPFIEKWPKDLSLEHEFNLAEAKKLLAKKDDGAPAIA